MPFFPCQCSFMSSDMDQKGEERITIFWKHSHDLFYSCCHESDKSVFHMQIVQFHKVFLNLGSPLWRSHSAQNSICERVCCLGTVSISRNNDFVLMICVVSDTRTLYLQRQILLRGFCWGIRRSICSPFFCCVSACVHLLAVAVQLFSCPFPARQAERKPDKAALPNPFEPRCKLPRAAQLYKLFLSKKPERNTNSFTW